MTYNLELEQRLDRWAEQLGKIAKKKMFGGVGYLMNGNMVFGIHKQSLIVRTSPKKAEEMLERDSVSLFNMTGRPMMGWLLVSPEGLRTEKQLTDWLNLSVDYVKTLPGK